MKCKLNHSKIKISRQLLVYLIFNMEFVNMDKDANTFIQKFNFTLILKIT